MARGRSVWSIDRDRDVRLDFIRVIAIFACIVGHALQTEHLDVGIHCRITMMFPDTAGLFIMASGAIILMRPVAPGWRYVWHRISTFLPEFILFSTVYVLLDRYYGWGWPGFSLAATLERMFFTPTWSPGWFILALIGVYAVMPMMAAWVRTATRRQLEIGLILWLSATVVPVLKNFTAINVPDSIFGTLFNYAGYMLLGYYMVRYNPAQRPLRFRVMFFAVTIGIGFVFGYFLGLSAAKWGYIDGLTRGLNLTVAMVTVAFFGAVLFMPLGWFNGLFGRVVTFLSVISLGIYCCHYLVLRYWAVPAGVNWALASVITFAVSIPVAWGLYALRRYVVSRL